MNSLEKPVELCSSQCWNAQTPPTRCRCQRCGGTFHGVDGKVYIAALVDARHRGLDQMTDTEIVGAA